MQNCVENVYVTNKGEISLCDKRRPFNPCRWREFLGCVPVPGWQHKIDFVTKAVLDKKILLFWYEKKKQLPLKGCHLGFSE